MNAGRFGIHVIGDGLYKHAGGECRAGTGRGVDAVHEGSAQCVHLLRVTINDRLQQPLAVAEVILHGAAVPVPGGGQDLVQ